MKQLLLLVVFIQLAFNSRANKSDNLIKGKLDNGFTYYIYKTKKNPDKATFYFLQKAGAILEEDHEDGLAHFLEHMAFNGTEHFPANTIGKHFSKYGIIRGRNINAYTGIDQTVYFVNNVPTNNEEAVNDVLNLTSDWSNAILLTEKDVDEERGVIIEEHRKVMRGNKKKINEFKLARYNNTRWSHRSVIGEMDVLENFKVETIREFYEKWYRPDMQSIVVYGDVNVNKIEEAIKARFKSKQVSPNALKIPSLQIPENKELLTVTYKEKDIKNTSYHYEFRLKTLFDKSSVDYRTYLIKRALFNALVKKDLANMYEQDNVPFKLLEVVLEDIKGGYETIRFSVMPKPNKDAESFEYIAQYINTLKDSPFTLEQFNVQKQILLSFYKSQLKADVFLNEQEFIEKIKKEFLTGQVFQDKHTEALEMISLIESSSFNEFSRYIKEINFSKNACVLKEGNTNASFLSLEQIEAALKTDLK